MSKGSKHELVTNSKHTEVDRLRTGSNLRLVMNPRRKVSEVNRAVRSRAELSLRWLLEMTKVIVWEAELNPWRFTYVSEHAAKIFGYPLSKWYQPGFLTNHIHPDDEHLIVEASRFETADQFDSTFRMIAADGRVVWLQNFATITADTPQRLISGFMIDISDRRCAEEALKDLGGRLIAAQEEERRRIARELHDDFNQRIALLSIELEQLGQMTHEPGVLQQSTQLQKQAEELSADIHQLSYRLHPTKLDHLGLGAAVKSLCEELSQSANLRIEFEQAGVLTNIPKDVELCLFRIAQEALRNCIRHSGARSARVSISKRNHALNLLVSDDGCGFDPNNKLKETGLGFISMRERLHLVGGELHVYSRPQLGTQIKASVPVVDHVER